MNLEHLVRPNIWNLRPYSAARHEFEGRADVYLDANENPFDNGLNRYPDPLQRKLKSLISASKGVEVDRIFLGNGSDEAIDILIRIFCQPGSEEVLIFPPTYGMYKVCADVSDIKVVSCPLTDEFQIDVDRAIHSCTAATKMMFVCSPNNPTGNVMNRHAIELLLSRFKGIVVIDEAYGDFSGRPSWTEKLDTFDNLVIMQTFSKAWGLAGIRLGMAFAHSSIIRLMNAVKPPYNVNQLTQSQAIDVMLNRAGKVQALATVLVEEKQRMADALMGLSHVLRIYPSDANFLLIKFSDHQKVFHSLKNQGIVVRDRSTAPGCDQCLRITVGTPTENDLVIKMLSDWS